MSPSLAGSNVAVLLLRNSRTFLTVITKSDHHILRNDLPYLYYDLPIFCFEEKSNVNELNPPPQ
jgi:hypothetical protein